MIKVDILLLISLPAFEYRVSDECHAGMVRRCWFAVRPLRLHLRPLEAVTLQFSPGSTSELPSSDGVSREGVSQCLDSDYRDPLSLLLMGTGLMF